MPKQAYAVQGCTSVAGRHDSRDGGGRAKQEARAEDAGSDQGCIHGVFWNKYLLFTAVLNSYNKKTSAYSASIFTVSGQALLRLKTTIIPAAGREQ